MPQSKTKKEFILEKNRNLEYGLEKSNIMRDQKDEHNLKY